MLAAPQPVPQPLGPAAAATCPPHSSITLVGTEVEVTLYVTVTFAKSS